MPVTYQYPTNFALTTLAQNLIQTASMDDPIFRLFPIRRIQASRLRWSIKDNYKGLMGLRGLGGEPTRITRVGANLYEAIPGYYGEFATIDEVEMTDRAAAGAFIPTDVPVRVDDLVAESQEQLVYRQVTRMKQIAWTLAISATFSIPLPDGGIGHTESYTAQTLTVSPLWSSTTTAHPLADFRGLQPTYGRGTSTAFDARATAWMNSVTANYLIANTLATDLGGRRVSGGNTIQDLQTVNRILLEMNLPQIAIWDDGYIDDANAFQLYIPDGKVLVVGARPGGDTPGEFLLTRNANNPAAAPGPYSFVKDYTQGPIKTVPPRIEVHQGFNGGPVIERPTQLIVMTVA